MYKSNSYYQVATSLPLLQGKMGSDFAHMTRLSFEKRLQSLEPEDLEMVEELEDFVIWERHSMDNATDEEFKRKAIALQKRYKNKTFLEIIDLAVKKRLLLGLLRKRHSGLETAPDIEEYWAMPEISYNVQNNWSQKDFGIKNLSKELSGYDELIQNDEALQMEKQILQMTWEFCEKISSGHYFDIDFILIYAVRRNINERWKIINSPQEITEKFNRLAMEAIHGKQEESDR